MTKMNTLSVNGNAYTLEDAGAVAFDRAQTLTEEEKQQALENLGIGNKYQLIEDITLEEAVSAFRRNAAPDGTPYDFTDVRVIVRAAAGESSATLNCQMYYQNNYGGQIYYCSTSQGINTVERTSVFKCYNDKGMVEHYVLSGNSSQSSAVNMYRRLYSIDTAWRNVKGITLTVSTNIPAGTRIRIYAVRG